ncbi:MAG TPA: nucleotide sugar epimerase [Candidatus Jacksonbacteria bacterium]|nr:MAG: Nucleotide sugar epimerase/dehydratase [Parcubacteria group bacterium GW2011_GWC2_44_22]OGY74645.1 MAG: nucleotide sugar epimerase [Candidatus Jacksonbacteria bacterium RIFOXYA2_FULL_43_12]OGY75348.1 MAG: nucleotide sugar epimerase [Candidatus Jacksonbacteria bacterium RIFOXYB2_FULL_44_15]OGY82042.1 MAG: nucleotide sugar epimerase [Candidatus Jacksonbacteria bacterium RIFOXYD2_FULL_43_21]HBH45853.1 nucleotide sugar epimerase [Candidatus Jacksonbacteria bacterium]
MKNKKQNNLAVNFSGSKILITGGAGFIGSNLIKMLLAATENISITIVDNLLSAEKINVPQNKSVNFIEGSIADDKILRQLDDRYDYVFHLATFHGNQNSIFDPLADHDNNTLTTLKLYERLKNFKKLKKVVYASAGCSVAKKTYGPASATHEDAPVEINQDSPYSISKIIGEFYSTYYFKQHSLPTVRARFQNVYGLGEILGAGKWRGTAATVWRNVIPTFIYKALKGEPLPLQNHGRASRDFIYVNDICRGLLACALKGKHGDVYNLASGHETTIRQLAILINQITGNTAGFELLPKRSWDHSGRRFGSTTKAKQELDFVAQIRLPAGLKLTVDWTKNSLKLIESNINKHQKKIGNK